MSAFVLDNSVTMRWCFEETSTPFSERVLERILLGDRAYVPILWLYEVAAVLAKSQQKGVISAPKAGGFLEDLRSLDIVVEEAGFSRVLTEVHRLAVEHRLTAYDAAYLELAIRKGLPLASLDEDLSKAALAAGVPSIQL